MRSSSLALVHRYAPYEDKVYSAFDPLLLIAGQSLAFIADQPFKYLGRKIWATLSEALQRSEVMDRLQFLLRTVEEKPLTGMMKA